MSNTDKIKQEIQRLLDKYKVQSSIEAKHKTNAYADLLSFINALPEETKDICSGCTNVKGCVTCVDGNMKELTVEDMDLEKAAEEYAYTNWESEDYHEGASEGLPFDPIGHTEKCFKAGAEWMAGQGETVTGIITKVGDKLDVETTEYLIPEESEFERGDKVILQIRKEQ